jgi:hypothetical protein
MNARIVIALLSLLASAPTFAANLYEYWGFMQPAPGADNPWGLSNDGTLFWLRVLVDSTAVDQDCCNPGYAEFDPLDAILYVGEQRALVSYVSFSNTPASFYDGTSYDTFAFWADVELSGVRMPVSFSVRIPATTFTLDATPGAPDLPPLFDTVFPVQFGAAGNDFVLTSPDHEHGVYGRVDSDADGWDDQHDNCVLAPNNPPHLLDSQTDTDGDGIGNLCDGDFNNDCQTNFIDLGAMQEHFFVPGDLQTDLNADGITNFADLGVLKGLFFQPPGPSGIPNICEPHSP